MFKVNKKCRLGSHCFGDSNVTCRSDEVEVGVATKYRRTREIVRGKHLTTSPVHINITTTESTDANQHFNIRNIII